MIIRTQSELSPVLERFPFLYRCWHEAGSPLLENTFIGNLLSDLRDNSMEFGLTEIEAALESLLHKFKSTDLSEQIRDLFAEGNRSESRWEKNWTELTALAYINDRGLLSSLGWPAVNCDTPPFDCLLSFGGQLVPCDIKTIGSAFSHVWGAVNAVIQKWAAENGLGNLPFALRYRSTDSGAERNKQRTTKRKICISDMRLMNSEREKTRALRGQKDQLKTVSP